MTSFLKFENFTTTPAAQSWTGGRGNCAVTASNFNSETITLQSSQDGGTTWWAVGTDTTFTAAGQGNFELPACELRLLCSGAVTAGYGYVNSVKDNAAMNG